MEKKKIKKLYESQINLIKEYNKYYYEGNDPKVSDKEYDELKLKITELEKKYNFLS